MNGSRSAERVGQEIVRLCHAGLDSRTLRVEVIRHLRKVIPVDASFFATADPATLLFTSAVVDDVLAQATTRFVENEFLKDDSVKFARLAGDARRSAAWAWRPRVSWPLARATRRSSLRWTWGMS
jgi:hypothetical protein